MVAFIIALALGIKRNTIKNSSEQIDSSGGESLLLYANILYVFESITQCSSNTVHWVFAMKYWGVAQKL